MPYLEYRCSNGHTTEEFFKTISAGEAVQSVQCAQCGTAAEKIFSVPVGFGLYGRGGGYYKPSATKRFSTKTANSKHGNKFSHG